MDLIVTNVDDSGYHKQRRGGKRVAVIFTDSDDRPMRKGDIAGDFAWRREHAVPFKPKVVLEAAAELLGRYGITPEKIFYSRYAGCSSCPCSPGYLVYGTRTEYHRGSLRLDVDTVEVAQKQSDEAAVRIKAK